MKITFPTVIKLTWLSTLLCLTGCSTIYALEERIPGLDRIFHRFSKAEVGPIKTEDGEIVSGTETDSFAEKTSISTTDNEQKDIGETELALTNIPSKELSSPELKSPNKPIETTKIDKPVISSPTAPVTLKIETKPDTKLEKKPDIKKTKHKLSGNIKLLAKTGFISAEGVIVRLNRVDGTPLSKPNKETHHDMDMVDKVYAPGQMVINKGDTVNFINKDAIQHNVFSSSGENAFDLGTFGGELQRAVKLNQEGVVKIYCNIHPNMAAFVAVDDTGISHVIRTDNGFFEFSNLSAGEYQLTLWSVRGEQTQRVELSTEKKVHLDLTFDTSNYEPPKPINKYGKQYKKKRVHQEYY